MKCFAWAVWKKCRLVGYVKAYSEWEARRRAENEFGNEIFIVRFCSMEDGSLEPVGID